MNPKKVINTVNTADTVNTDTEDMAVTEDMDIIVIVTVITPVLRKIRITNKRITTKLKGDFSPFFHIIYIRGDNFV